MDKKGLEEALDIMERVTNASQARKERKTEMANRITTLPKKYRDTILLLFDHHQPKDKVYPHFQSYMATHLKFFTLSC